MCFRTVSKYGFAEAEMSSVGPGAGLAVAQAVPTTVTTARSQTRASTRPFNARSAMSDVDRVPERGQRGLQRGLGQRGMRVDRVHDLVDGGFERTAHRELVADLRRLGAGAVR